jgi:hypothetical protein
MFGSFVKRNFQLVGKSSIREAEVHVKPLLLLVGNPAMFVFTGPQNFELSLCSVNEALEFLRVLLGWKPASLQESGYRKLDPEGFILLSFGVDPDGGSESKHLYLRYSVRRFQTNVQILPVVLDSNEDLRSWDKSGCILPLRTGTINLELVIGPPAGKFECAAAARQGNDSKENND